MISLSLDLANKSVAKIMRSVPRASRMFVNVFSDGFMKLKNVDFIHVDENRE